MQHQNERSIEKRREASARSRRSRKSHRFNEKQVSADKSLAQKSASKLSDIRKNHAVKSSTAHSKTPFTSITPYEDEVHRHKTTQRVLGKAIEFSHLLLEEVLALDTKLACLSQQQNSINGEGNENCLLYTSPSPRDS